MKYRYLALVLLLCSFMISCYDDDNIIPEPTKPYYDITDDPSDPVQHYRYEFYKKYNSIIVTDVSVADYRYNFKSVNQFRMVPLVQDEELIMKGIKFFEDNFINIFPEGYFDEHPLPVNIILADSIFKAGSGEYNYILSSCSKNYLAIGGIREGFDELSDKEKKAIKGAVFARYFRDYDDGGKKLFDVPKSFYEVSDDFYGNGVISIEGFMATKESIDWYKYGLISWDPGSVVSLPWMEMFMAPYEKVDYFQWLNFISVTGEEELQDILSEYPLMKEKFDILDAAVRDGLGMSIKELLK